MRTAARGAAEGSLKELSRIVEQIRHAWPRTRIVVRGDADFGKNDLMVGCEDHEIDDVFGYGQNPRLNHKIAKALDQSRRRCLRSGKPSRRYRNLQYRTRRSWPRKRRVVAQAEWRPGLRGKNARYGVTNISRKKVGARELYEPWYCARGDMENRIKDPQLWRFSDRTSAPILRANQLRMYFSAFAGVLIDLLRRVGLRGTQCARWRVDTLRSRLLKLAGRVTKTVRRFCLSFASIFPLQEVFAHALVHLRAAAQAPPGPQLLHPITVGSQRLPQTSVAASPADVRSRGPGAGPGTGTNGKKRPSNRSNCQEEPNLDPKCGMKSVSSALRETLACARG